MSGTDETTVERALVASSVTLAEAVNRGFEGYVQSFNMNGEIFDARFRPEHIDLAASRLVSLAGAPAGLVLVSRRGLSSRIAAMGLATELRGQGLGRRLLDEVVGEARSRGDRRMLLEVIVGNEPAIALYRNGGFRIVRTLVGYVLDAGPGLAEPLLEVDPLEVARACGREGEPDLPWMLEAETLAAAGPPVRGFCLEGAGWAMVREAGLDSLVLRALVVRRERRLQGVGARLISALKHKFPQRSVQVPALVPEELAPQFFERCGFRRDKISQFEMVCDLDSTERPPR